MHVTLAKNLSYKNPVLICYKNLANGFINVSKLIWHWANEVAAAISAGLISVCRSSCQAASQWKGGFDILAVKGGFDILAVSWDEQSGWCWGRRCASFSQSLPGDAADHQAASPSQPRARAPSALTFGALQTERGSLMDASHHSIYLPERGKMENSQVPEPFRKYPLFFLCADE